MGKARTMSYADAQSNYCDEAGKAYLDQRTGAASDRVQAMRAALFSDIGGDEYTVLDFGCGTGGVLSRTPAARRVGVEIGTEAGALASKAGIEVYTDLADLPTDSVDRAISFHAIEHTESPASILREIVRVVRPGGRVRLVVPGENPRDPRQSSWRPNDDMHLYTWTPLIFGNLAKVAGFSEIATRVEPMTTGSRIVRIASVVPPVRNWLHQRVATRLNSWNVILDAAVAA
ncbi:methyltransferase domain-containing protein [Altererythrobacter aerius]|uniref:Methyltransferase domain-containing protein n=1 Tax=Tsuneonella aeria TaxID=1837929 RepID=A0A6I4TDX0_9SPHN|nr:class I SAM-dependent methyltransferase [Tsuneonella aeria]MXO75501.1 methyltransferase domain-containing protein [Tsuneonella aeria]